MKQFLQPRPGVVAARTALANSAPHAGRLLQIDVRGKITEKTAASVRTALARAPQATTLRIVVDSLGGDVRAALAIYQALREHPAKRKLSACYVDCQSAAIIPFLAGDLRRAHNSATILLHRAEVALPLARRWTADRHSAAASAITEADEAVSELIIERTGASASVIAAEMATENPMPLIKARALGIIQAIGDEALDQSWPDRARAAARNGDSRLYGAGAYRFSDSYLAACRLS